MKEVLHLRRDPTTLVFALIIPLVQLLLFGFAIDLDIRHVPMVVVDMDRSRESRAYIARLKNTNYLDLAGYEQTPEQAMERLRRGSARVVLIIPPDFARRSVPGSTSSVRVLMDGSDSQVATPAMRAFLTPGGQTGANTDGSQVETRINLLFNPQMRTQVFMIPGLIGIILQLVTVSLTSFSLVRERELGTMEQLMVSPVGRLGLMLGKLTPYAFLAMAEVAFVLILGRIFFNVRVMGSVILLVLLSLPFVLAALSLGLLISTVAKTQGQALQMTLLITLPSILLSGYMFPRETMPGSLYLLSNIIPVTHFLQILRGIIVRGAGFTDVWPSVLALLVITAVLLGLSTLRFRKSIA